VWRIFENGVEHLAADVKITGKIFTERTEECGETKWNISCYGHMTIDHKTATATIMNQQLLGC